MHCKTCNDNNCRQLSLLAVSNFIFKKNSKALLMYGNYVISEMPDYILTFDIRMLIWFNIQSLVFCSLFSNYHFFSMIGFNFLFLKVCVLAILVFI